MLVKAATSPLGSWAGQFARLSGTWTVAIVSSQEECKYAVQTLGFQSAVNRAASDFKNRLSEACVVGIDVCIETIGGALWLEFRPLMNEGGRIVLNGTWAQFEHPLSGAADYGSMATIEALIRKKLLLGGARSEDICFADFAADVGRAMKNGASWTRVNIETGLLSAPRAWLSLIDRPEQGITVIRLQR